MYTGDWSDKSTKWTAALKKEVGFVDANDGAFFLPFDTYVTNYWGDSVSMYQAYKGYHQENLNLAVRTKTYTVNNPID